MQSYRQNSSRMKDVYNATGDRSVYMYICIHVCIYIYIYICTCVYVYVLIPYTSFRIYVTRFFQKGRSGLGLDGSGLGPAGALCAQLLFFDVWIKKER